jgi:hypothetical protein
MIYIAQRANASWRNVIDAERAQRMKKAVLASVIASVIVILFIQPLLGLLWYFVLSNIKVLSDASYRHAALGMHEGNAFVLYMTLNGFVFASVVFFIYIAFFELKSPDSARRNQTPSEAPTIPAAHKRMRLLRILRVLTAIYAASVLFVCSYSLTLHLTDIQLNTSFHQRMAVLAPHITDLEYKELVASWAGMQTEADYKAIVAKMEKSASSAGVKLPDMISGASLFWFAE